MPAIMPTHLLTLGKAKTPDEFKTMVWDILGTAISEYEVNGTDVLFVTYIEPEMTAGGIIRGDRSQQEILFQGSVGLVVGLGPMVNKWDSRGNKWEGREIKINDWIVCRFADCWEIHIEGVSCRMIDPETIKGFIKRPEIIASRPAAQTRVAPIVHATPPSETSPYSMVPLVSQSPRRTLING